VHVETLFADIEQADEVSASESTAGFVLTERRTEDRRRVRVPAWVSGDVADRGSRGFQVLLSDLSDGGVGFRDRRAYQPGTRHWIMCNAPHVRMSTRIRIVSCRPNPTGGYDIGAAFF
jgi:hypothetical protein